MGKRCKKDICLTDRISKFDNVILVLDTSTIIDLEKENLQYRRYDNANNYLNKFLEESKLEILIPTEIKKELCEHNTIYIKNGIKEVSDMSLDKLFDKGNKPEKLKDYLKENPNFGQEEMYHCTLFAKEGKYFSEKKRKYDLISFEDMQLVKYSLLLGLYNMKLKEEGKEFKNTVVYSSDEHVHSTINEFLKLERYEQLSRYLQAYRS